MPVASLDIHNVIEISDPHSLIPTPYSLSMIRHYLTFEKEAALLDAACRGARFVLCWSQEKERVILLLERDGEEIAVEIALGRRVAYALVSGEMRRARKNTRDLFTVLAGRVVESVEMDEVERAIRFRCDRGVEFVALFFGRGGGNLICLKEGRALDSYRSVGDEYDSFLHPDDEIVMRDELTERLRASDDTAARALVRSIPQLGPRLAAEALHRAGVDAARAMSDLSVSEIGALLDTIDRLYAECRAAQSCRIYHTEAEPVFSLIPLSHFEGGGEREIGDAGSGIAASGIAGSGIAASRIETFDDLTRAVRIYRSLYYKVVRFAALRKEAEKIVATRRAKAERGLLHAEEIGDSPSRAVGYEAAASLLLANIGLLARGMEEIELVDWEGEPQRIRLDAKLSPSENVDRYYRKARGARIDVERAIERRETLRAELATTAALAARLDELNGPDDYERLMEIAEEIGMRLDEKGKEKPAEAGDRFRRFTVEGGYEVYAGKSAANNDELTLRFARPNDIWLHARGSSGSHVVLRWNDAQGRPPKRTLEEAAMIAAFYSGAKHSNLVPVAWTRKKYVRKPKGAAVGAVVMGREEVVLVPPRLPE